jgi:tRNA-specific 2-thiouridylase
VATGHYARTIKRENGDAELWRGNDRAKDQSYFLHRLSQDYLRRSVFPLGEMLKEQVRKQADKNGLASHTVSESQEVCFLSGKDYRPFVEDSKGPESGAGGRIVNEEGDVLGEHGGVHRYTVGQRHGLGIASPRPYYVKEVRPETNLVVVARKEGLYSRKLCANRFNWIAGRPHEKSIEVTAQVRYRHRAARGRLDVLSSEEVEFVFDEPQWAITPGQALACYDGHRVLGGGWITKQVPAVADPD